MAPYRLQGDPAVWLNMKRKEEECERRLQVLEEYAPGTREKVLWRSVCSPGDTENRFPNMKEGSIKQGAYLPLQMGYLRPNEECSDSRTPIKNLYIGGASSHPGGLILLGPGYLAANKVLEDLGIPKWWTEPEMVRQARERGLL